MSRRAERRRADRARAKEPERFATIASTIELGGGKWSMIFYAPPGEKFHPESFDHQIEQRTPVPDQNGGFNILVGAQVDPDGSSAMLTWEPVEP